MVEFRALIERSGHQQGPAMTGWAYIDVPQTISEQLKPGCRQVYRVRGEIDGQSFSGLALMPKGEGVFILAINGTMRKMLKKGVGDFLSLRLEEDREFVIEIPEDLEICLSDDEGNLMERFKALPKSHRNYFLNHINGAKTEPTRAKRIAMTVEAMAMGLDFGAMIRLDKARRQRGE
ncbi:YdeI/OmpD-associated family protein [Parapedobacter indicus]|uniref:Bacteriocin-protection, YdeI or OmpD-Associated n=1 Tax=Parapedobacter indicus TaxID=1477437 RepID=A0A1I3DJC6_9SPHI|nr:YdeI/OmpD-associated family protein [Parapedobacter indicus]PPL04706.1 bacteriocin resistance YdeI/OmpD-like protein [Parapedobacter indicus]SFH86825.1 Bacteriocin-protection, YdeI or OmpD-Associated [Parapedobacter indicus]